MKFVIGTALVLASLGFGGVGASAAPVPPQGLSSLQVQPATEVRITRMERRRQMRRSQMMRNRNMRRPANAGNAMNPSRPPAAQNQGGTSGGPRY